MNLANLLTCSRVVMAVFFAWFLFSNNPFGKMVALFFFVMASLTDYWDGVVARGMGEVSQFGKLMDPIADKMLTLAAFVSFWKLELIPFWLVAVVVLRDVVVTASRFLVPPEKRGARASGKQKTVLQLIYIIAVLLYLTARQMPEWNPVWNATALDLVHAGMWAVVLVTVWSGARVLLKSG